jgi:hypothetical protein
MRSLSGLTCGLVTASNGLTKLRPAQSPARSRSSSRLSCGAENTTTSTSSVTRYDARSARTSSSPISVAGPRCEPSFGSMRASGVMAARWKSAVDPKLAIAAPKCLSSSDRGTAPMPSTKGTDQ